MRGIASCGHKAPEIHPGVRGQAHRGCPRNAGHQKPCKWREQTKGDN